MVLLFTHGFDENFICNRLMNGAPMLQRLCFVKSQIFSLVIELSSFKLRINQDETENFM